MNSNGGDAAPDRLLSLRIEGFRGFNEPTVLEMDASAVVLHGANGSGKSSVFDALQWLLTGALPRLDQWKMRKNEHYIVNAFSLTQVARVEARFRSQGQIVTVSRAGNDRDSFLEVHDRDGQHSGASAADLLGSHLAPGELTLAEVLLTSGLLQQDDLRSMLQTTPDARYRQLMRLLGLESLERFERSASTRRAHAREAARSALAAVEQARVAERESAERLETTILQVERASDAAESEAAIRRLRSEFSIAFSLPEPSQLRKSLPQVMEEARQLARRAAAAVGHLSLLLREEDIAEPVELAESSATLESLQAQLGEAKRVREEARTQYDLAVRENAAIDRLAAAAEPLLHADEESAPCPVCLTKIRPRDVIESLRARASGADSLRLAQVHFDVTGQNAASIADEITRAAQVHADHEERNRKHAIVEQHWANFVTTVESLAGGSLIAPRTSVGTGSPDERSNTLSERIASVNRGDPPPLAQLSALHDSALELESRLDALLQQEARSRMAAERSAGLPRQQEAASVATAQRKTLEDDYQSRRDAERSAVALAERATAISAEIFRERFATLEPLMNDVYSRLDPHPAFTHLSFIIEPFRAKGTANAIVRDIERDITVNPMLIFSSAQANIVVLSAFLALGLAAGRSGLPFLLLDDPLQALDDVNVLGFADMARHIRRERQLVLATHEERFAGLLERKLSGRRPGDDLVVHQFFGWSRSGPEIMTRSIPGTQIKRSVFAA